MSALLTTRFQMIEIPVGPVALGVGQRLKIPDQPQLRTQTNQVIIIQAIAAYDAVSNPNTPTGAATATVANMAVSYLTLNVFGYETNLYIPMNELIVQQSADTAVQRSWAPGVWRFNNITKVDWSKSYIQVGAIVGANVSYLLGVWYYVSPDDAYQTSPTPLEMPIVS